MLDDFFLRALVAGIGVAVVAGPLGCFIVWRRMAYYGDTLSHAALLGAALALLADINITLAVFSVSVLMSLALVFLQGRAELSSDAILGLMSHSALALGLVALALMSWVRFDLNGLLFGDILAVSSADIVVIYAGGIVVLTALIFVWRPLFAATVNEELAAAEGMKPAHTNLIFMGLMAITIAIALKIVGALLITSLLIIPAASARRFAATPEMMAFFAALIGAIAVIGGLYGSLQWDTPTGPSIVVAAMVLFLVAHSPVSKLVRRVT